MDREAAFGVVSEIVMALQKNRDHLFAMPKLSKFVDEVLVEGTLYHVLNCGHVHPAVNVEPDMLPAEEQACETCEKAELQSLLN